MDSIAGYRLERVLGEGGGGAVWAARSPSGVPCAVKVLRAGRGAAGHHRERFRAEVRAMAGLSHPNVAAIYDAGFETDAMWLAMELAQDTLTRRPPRAWNLARRVLEGILLGLAHAHARGVVHRDLKPGNVLLVDGVPKLADFGLARLLDAPAPESERPAGTPRYMPPEQRDGRWRDSGPWTDLFALGQLVLRVLGDKVDVPEAALAWVARLVEPEPRQRFRRAADALVALRSLPAVGSARLPRDIGAASDTFTLTEPVVPGEAPPALAPPCPVPLPALGDVRRPPATPEPPRIRAAALVNHRRPPMIGREPLLDTAWSAFEATVRDRLPRCVLLKGPAGCGKSVIAVRIGHDAHATGLGQVDAAVHTAEGSRVDGVAGMVARELRCIGLPYDAARRRVAAFTEGTGWTDRFAPRAVFELIRPALDPPGAEPPPILHWDTALVRYRLAAEVLHRDAEGRVPVVWADDLHWGPDTVAFIQFLLGEPRPVFVVATARSDEAPSIGTAALHALGQHPRVRVLDLEPLSDAALRRSLDALVDVPRAVRDWAVERAGGHALLARQLLESALEDGARPAPAVSLEELWQRRVRRALVGLPPSAVHSAALLAVLGTEVDLDDWRTVCSALSLPIQQVLELLLVAGLLKRSPLAPGVTLTHDTLASALLGMVPPEVAAALHGAVADQMADASGFHRLCKRARHLEAAGRLEASAGALEQAFRTLPFRELEEAKWVLEQHAELMARMGAPEDGRARMVADLQRVAMQHWSGDRAGTVAQCDALLERARGRWPDLLCAVQRRRARALLELGRLHEARTACAEALALSVGEASRHRSASLRALIALSTGEADAERWVDEMEATAPAGADGDVHLYRGRIAMRRGDAEAAAVHVERAFALFEAEGALLGLANAWNELGEVARARGRSEAAVAAYAEALSLARLLSMEDAPILEINLGIALCALERWEDASALFAEAEASLEQQRKHGHALAAAVCLLAPLSALGGDVAGLLQRLEGPWSASGFVDPDLARMAELAGLRQRDPVLARRLFAMARDQLHALGDVDGVARVEARLADPPG